MRAVVWLQSPCMDLNIKRSPKLWSIFFIITCVLRFKKFDNQKRCQSGLHPALDPDNSWLTFPDSQKIPTRQKNKLIFGHCQKLNFRNALGYNQFHCLMNISPFLVVRLEKSDKIIRWILLEEFAQWAFLQLSLWFEKNLNWVGPHWHTWQPSSLHGQLQWADEKVRKNLTKCQLCLLLWNQLS